MTCSTSDPAPAADGAGQAIVRRRLLAGAVAAWLVPASSRAGTTGHAGHAFLYWGAADCGPCLAWERDHLSAVQAELKDLGVPVRVLKKPRIADPWSADHLSADPFALAMLRQGSAPRATPHFIYVADGLRLIDIPGYSRQTWAAAHRRAVARLYAAAAKPV